MTKYHPNSNEGPRHRESRTSQHLIIKLVLGAAILAVATGCGLADSDLSDEIGPRPDGVLTECDRYEDVEVNKIDLAFCGITVGGAPGMRIWQQQWGRSCVSVTYANHAPVSRERREDWFVQEYATLDCTNR